MVKQWMQTVWRRGCLSAALVHTQSHKLYSVFNIERSEISVGGKPLYSGRLRDWSTQDREVILVFEKCSDDSDGFLSMGNLAKQSRRFTQLSERSDRGIDLARW